MIFKTMLGCAAVALFVAPAMADTVTTLNNAPFAAKAGTDWGKYSDDNSANSSAVITNTSARNGNGSLELKGDTTRVQTGFQYAPFTTNITPLSGVSGLTFDWQVAADSTNKILTPALRLLIQDGSTRTQLIWEGANNGVANNPVGNWYSTGLNDLFYQNVGGKGNGPVYQPGTQTYVLKSVADWVSTFSSNAYVSAISVGAGSGAGAGYHAFVDNVTLTAAAGPRNYNFETAATGAVPEPATWAMTILGMGAVGFAMRRRQKVATRVAYAS